MLVVRRSCGTMRRGQSVGVWYNRKALEMCSVRIECLDESSELTGDHQEHGVWANYISSDIVRYDYD